MRMFPMPVEMEPAFRMDLSPMVSTVVLIFAAAMFIVAGMLVAAGTEILYCQE